MSGERGLISYLDKKDVIRDLKSDEVKLIKNIEKFDFRNSLLSDNLDLDFVETLIIERFLFGKKGDKIYIIKNNDTKN